VGDTVADEWHYLM